MVPEEKPFRVHCTWVLKKNPSQSMHLGAAVKKSFIVHCTWVLNKSFRINAPRYCCEEILHSPLHMGAEEKPFRVHCTWVLDKSFTVHAPGY
jgi:hypothetical protein